MMTIYKSKFNKELYVLTEKIDDTYVRAINVKDRYSYTIPFEDLELWIELEEKIMKVNLPKFIVECPACKTYLDNRKFSHCPICGKNVSKIIVNMSNTCDKCEHSSELDGNYCYNCIKGIENNFKAKQDDEVRVGNEIISDRTKAVVLRINSWNDWECLCSTGVFILDSETQKCWHKTGRYFPQIREMLEQIKGDK